ncbi:MAG TPA: glycosyltransferase family 1 protein [Ramlibacter sp.]|nr:glycosyltransferase family 1 protein [Ramlibacter sp.]
MRVAYNATSLIGPLTGIGQHAYQVALRVAQREDVDLFMFYATYFERKVEPRKERYTPQLRQFVRSFVPYSYDIALWKRQRKFTAGAQSIRFDLYHEPNFLAYDFDGPLVLTVHDLSWIRYPHTHPKERVRAMHRYFEPSLRRASVVLTVSGFVKQEVVEVFGIDPAKIRVIGNGLDPLFRPMGEAETKAALARHGLAYGRYLLSVGTLEPRKNLERTVQAYSLLPVPLRERYPLVIVGGKGWNTQGIQSVLAPLVASGQARVLGFLEREELAAITASATAMVYPSIYEGFGIPPLESMGCGVPALTSNVSSLPEVVGDTGLLVDPFDVDAIAAGMRTLLEDSALRASLAPRALERSKLFTWEACADGCFAAYADAMASSR